MSIAEVILSEWKSKDPFLSDLEGFQRFFDEEYPNRLRIAERKAKKQMDALVRVFTDPLVVMPGGWHDTIPEWMKGEVTLRRLIQVMNGDFEEATDIEVCIYLYTASLQAPMFRDWCEIYFWLVKKCMKEAGKDFPKDFEVKELTDYQKGMLRDLKRWIRGSQKRHKRR